MDKSTSIPKSASVKFKVPCKKEFESDENWLIVQRVLVERHSVLIGVMRTRDVVIKCGSPKDIHTEYENAHKLRNCPNFIKFFCTFTCMDNLNTVPKRSFVKPPFICSGGPDEMGVIVMPFYPLGCLNTLHWNENQLEALKSVIKQVCYASLYAYEKHGFIHPDLHTGNVLIRKTKKKAIEYGEYRIPVIDGMYAIIMDLENREPKKTIQKSLHTFLNLCNNLSSNSLRIENTVRLLDISEIPPLGLRAFIDRYVDSYKKRSGIGFF